MMDFFAEWNNTAEHLQFWIGRYRGTGEVVKMFSKHGS